MLFSSVCYRENTVAEFPGLTSWAGDTEGHSKPDLGTFIFHGPWSLTRLWKISTYPQNSSPRLLPPFFTVPSSSLPL